MKKLILVFGLLVAHSLVAQPFDGMRDAIEEGDFSNYDYDGNQRWFIAQGDIVDGVGEVIIRLTGDCYQVPGEG